MRVSQGFKAIFLHKSYVDMRNAINGLGQIVADEMGENLYDGGLFVFTNKKRDILKCMYWDRTGFALWIKRLEKEHYRWPRSLEGDKISITCDEFERLLIKPVELSFIYTL